jgi:hypothetical protein
VKESYEYGNETSGSTKSGKFLEYLSDYQLLQKDFSTATKLVTL